MWLICGSNTGHEQARININSSMFFNYGLGINFDYLDIMVLSPVKESILELKQGINSYNYIILTSPSCIDFVKDYIHCAENLQFIVMGRSSCQILQNITRLPVLYPVLKSGSLGVIEEVIPHVDLLNKKVLIIKGDMSSNLLASTFVSNKSCIVDELVVYQSKMVNINKNKFGTIIDGTRYSGVIVTSSLIVSWLFKLAGNYKLVESLKNKFFITWHHKISDKLRLYGVKNVQTIGYSE